MYTSIVVPLDGSDFGMCALPVALTLARRSDASVHLVHVREPIVSPEDGPRIYDDRALGLTADVTALATRLSREAAVQVDPAFLEGPAVPTIAQYVDADGHDLLVMMTHGRGGLSRWWLGSVADGLIRHTSVPLLLLRQESAWLADAAEPLFRRVLVPLDGSSVADGVLDHVMSLATPDVTVFVLLTVVVPVLPMEYPFTETGVFAGPLDDAQQRETALTYLERVADELRMAEGLVEVLVVTHANAAQAILDTASQQHADLIALSTHGRGGVSRLMHGSVADKIVRGAAVPVLVYRPIPLDARPSSHQHARATSVTVSTTSFVAA